MLATSTSDIGQRYSNYCSHRSLRGNERLYDTIYMRVKYVYTVFFTLTPPN